MENNLRYSRSFLIISYGVLIQFLILPFYEMPMLAPAMLKPYILVKSLIAIAFLLFCFCIHNRKLVRFWVLFLHSGCFSFVLIGQFFNPGYHFSVIQFMFICAIVFEGFSWMPTLLMVLFISEYYFHPFSNTIYPAYPFYHSDVYSGLISSWIISLAMERYVSRVRNRQGVLDKKLRYKGIKTDLFMHDLKNKFQPLMSKTASNEEFAEVLSMLQSFNSYHEDSEMNFEDVVFETKKKHEITGECSVFGTEDFFIDQMDLQTILCNLMKNSEKAALLKEIPLRITLSNKSSGFIYEDNAGGMTDEQLKFFTQKEIKPNPGHEKNGLGIFLVKKLVDYHGGEVVIKKIAGGTRFEIFY